MPTTLVWFRNDLRLHDHPALARALARGGDVVPVWCADPRQFGATPLGLPKTGPFRARFLLESVAALDRALREAGAALVIRSGRPERVLPELAAEVGADEVVGHAEVTSEETRVERRLARRLGDAGRRLRLEWGSTLHARDDLPFPVADVPLVFTRYRRAVEARCTVRDPLPAPRRIPGPAGVPSDPLPTLHDLGLDEPPADDRAVAGFAGGEAAALRRLRHYLWESDAVARYKDTRNRLLGEDASSKFSPWLAAGCLSPRLVHAEVRRYEEERRRNRSTYWLIFELVWRDFFRFTAAAHGDALFAAGGIRGVERTFVDVRERFDAWTAGRTGYPFVDANMVELARTGWMSNRGRQNVASFLAHDLGLDWRWGAEWFESLLLDYDPCSNWGNWNYVAGVGNDPRARVFDVVGQAERYDPDGVYVRLWLPGLAATPRETVHRPWEPRRARGLFDGPDDPPGYPPPIVPPRSGPRR